MLSNILDKTFTRFLASIIVNVLLASGIIHPDSQTEWVNGVAEVIGYIGVIATILIGLHHSSAADRERMIQTQIKQDILEEKQEVRETLAQPMPVVDKTTEPLPPSAFLP